MTSPSPGRRFANLEGHRVALGAVGRTVLEARSGPQGGFERIDRCRPLRADVERHAAMQTLLLHRGGANRRRRHPGGGSDRASTRRGGGADTNTAPTADADDDTAAQHGGQPRVVRRRDGERTHALAPEPRLET